MFGLARRFPIAVCTFSINKSSTASTLLSWLATSSTSNIQICARCRLVSDFSARKHLVQLLLMMYNVSILTIQTVYALNGVLSSPRLFAKSFTASYLVFSNLAINLMNITLLNLENFELLLELETCFFRGVHLERPKVTLIIWLRSNQICRFLVVWTMKSQRVWMNLDVLPLTMLYFVLLCLIMLYKTIFLVLVRRWKVSWSCSKVDSCEVFAHFLHDIKKRYPSKEHSSL